MNAKLFAILAAGTLAAAPVATSADNLVDTAVAVNSSGPYAGAFDTLIAALGAADPAVLETLSGKGQYTVFAPTDDAFAALDLDPSNVGTALSQEALTSILLYHVAHGRLDAGAVTDKSRVRTISKEFFSVSGTQLTDAVGRNANIIVTDVEADNGIIHAIDGVLLPFMP
jgi:uncharacterized surface protein with fasciclin (FAS1) repeats